jgi:PEP-CTERM motif
MRRVLMTATAAAVIGIATPASAGVTFGAYNGPDLTTKIKASTTNTVNDVSTVYGSTDLNGQSADVTFQGVQSDQTTLEAIHITDGAGYASITDSPLNSTNKLYELVIDVTSADFNQYMFSIQLVNDGTIFVYYQLAADPGSGWHQASPTGGIFQAANANNTYVLQGDVFTRLFVYSTSPIKEFKQNSITLGSVPAPLPEPATWAMMLLGFGGIGMALRRSRRRKPSLMQIA